MAKRTPEQIKADSAARKAAKGAAQTAIDNATEAAATTPFDLGTVTSITTAPLDADQRAEILKALDKQPATAAITVSDPHPAPFTLPAESYTRLARLGAQVNIGMGEWQPGYKRPMEQFVNAMPCMLISVRAADSARLPGLSIAHTVPPGEDPSTHLALALGAFIEESTRYFARRAESRSTILPHSRAFNRSPLTLPPDDPANATQHPHPHPLDPSHPRHILTGSLFSQPLTGVPLRAPLTGLEPTMERAE